MKLQEIYEILDAYAPFSLQESYDKSGLLVGDPTQDVHRVLLTLDITVPVVKEAAAKRADLILSHHPVIWDPLRSISPAHPVWHMVQHQIGAICAHTNLDIAAGGLNDHIGNMMANAILMETERQPLAVLSGGRTLGKTAALAEQWDAESLAERLQEIFRCRALRYYEGQNAQQIRRIAWCSGSGGDFIPEAIAAGADALITGDCKHSVWMDAQNRGFTLFDCGHFETEIPVIKLFAKILRDAAPALETVISEVSTQPPYITI